VFAWIDEHLNYNNRTTSRVEVQHSVFKTHIENQHNYLDRLVDISNEVVNRQEAAILKSFERSRSVRKHEHMAISTFRQLIGVLSHDALDLLTKEVNRAHKLDSKDCRCWIQKCCGLLCACRLKKYLYSQQPIPRLTCLGGSLISNEQVRLETCRSS